MGKIISNNMENSGKNVFETGLPSSYGVLDGVEYYFKKIMKNPEKIFYGFGNNEDVGECGEFLTEKILDRMIQKGFYGLYLKNVYIYKTNRSTTEIDIIFITPKGIFVIESKNYSGWIFGNEYQTEWTSTLPNGDKNKFYNPVKQNENHIKWLKNYLKLDVPYFSIIAFSERCALKKITLCSDDIFVCNRDRLQDVIQFHWLKFPDILNEKQIGWAYEKLKPLTNANYDVKERHVENIKNASTSSVCPKCGEKLVLRTAKNGKYAGNQFYGCSNFPTCRYIRNI